MTAIPSQFRIVLSGLTTAFFSRTSLACAPSIAGRLRLLIMTACCVSLSTNLTLLAQDGPMGGFVAQLGHAINDLDSSRLVSMAEAAPDESTRIAIQNAANVITAANTNSIDDETDESTDDFLQMLMVLRSRPVEVSVASVSADTLAIVKQTRRSLLRAGICGDAAAISELTQSISQSQLPTAIEQELLRFATATKQIAPTFQNTPMAAAAAMSRAIRAQDQSQSDAAMTLLGEYRSADDSQREQLETSRGDGANRYSLMVAKEQERSKLMTAYATLYTAYINGEKTKLEMVQQMQEIQSKALDLKEKRALLYWALKKLRADNLRAKRDRQTAQNAAETEAETQTTAADISANWPTLFSHRKLRAASETLRQHLTSYSPSDSGQLSVCFARCVNDIQQLHRLLGDDLPGMTINQRAGLQRYLRKLQNELSQPYSQKGYITQLNNANKTTLASITNDQPNDKASTTVAIRLSGDDTTLASFALFRSLSKSIVSAGKQGDLKSLTGIAAAVRDSDLLIEEHKKTLNELGSRAFRGQLNAADQDMIESPEQVLQMIAGVAGTTSQSSFNVPEKLSVEAYDILLTSMLDSDAR